MSMERREAALNDMGVVPEGGNLYIVASSSNTSDSLEVYEQFVRVDTNTNSQAFTLTLPPVSLAKGKIYSIAMDLAGGSALKIQDRDDSEDWSDITTMDATDDAVLLFSDGKRWFTLSSEIA